MKPIFFVLILSLGLFSCHKQQAKRPSSVMSSKRSLVNQWYGKDHFKPRDPKQENESLNQLDQDESTEVDAGQVQYPSTEEVVRTPSEPTSPKPSE